MNKIIIFFILLLVLPSCKTAKDVLSVKKKNSADEFLVEKKSPLVLPPEFYKLPSPSDSKNDKNLEEDVSIKDLVDKSKKNTSSQKKTNLKNKSIESSILGKIK